MRSVEQFFSMYTDYQLRTVLRDYTHRSIYKNWTNWCFRRSGNAVYEFDKGYDEDFGKKRVGGLI